LDPAKVCVFRALQILALQVFSVFFKKYFFLILSVSHFSISPVCTTSLCKSGNNRFLGHLRAASHFAENPHVPFC